MRALILLSLLLATLGAAATTREPITVVAEPNGVWHLSKASADVPPGAAGPKLISAPQPPRAKALPAGSISVSFQLSEKGVPVNVQIDKSSNKELDDEVIAMIREWRFKAALNGGVAVPSRAYLDLSLVEPPLPSEGRRPRKKATP